MQCCCLTEVPARSPRQLCIFITQKFFSRSEYPKNVLFNSENRCADESYALKNGKTIATGSVLRNIFWLDVNKQVAYTAATDAGVSWHKCLGHGGVPALTAMQKQGLLA